MKDETYWSYSVSSKGQSETYENGKIKVLDEMKDIVHHDFTNPGHYSSLMNAIKGFIDEQLNQFSEIKIEYDELNNDKFKLVAEVYYDYIGQPINDVIFRRWKRGEYDRLTHAYVEAIFVKHTIMQGSVKEYAEIMKAFPNIKTK